MAVLSIHLQEGFDDDLAIVRVNGAETARRSHLTTKRLLGYAEIVDLPKPAGGDIQLELSLPDRRLSASATVPGAGDSFVAANVADGRLRLTVRDQPFAYA
jgi:hypothetical protein